MDSHPSQLSDAELLQFCSTVDVQCVSPGEHESNLLLNNCYFLVRTGFAHVQSMNFCNVVIIVLIHKVFQRKCTELNATQLYTS